MALAERRYRRNRIVRFNRQPVQTVSAFPRLQPKDTSSFIFQSSFISVPRPYSELPGKAQKKLRSFDRSFMLALPIFPCSHPQSIVGANELNFCVRDGNRCTLTAINTNYLGTHPEN